MKIFNRISSHPRGAKTTLKKKAIIIGSTGATGNKLLKNLLKSDNWDKVTCISRNRVFKKKEHEKLSEVIIDSFDDLESTTDLWKGHDVFFNCIGTTRKIAGGAKGFIDVEYGISLKSAEIAFSAGILHASLISASGANPNAWAPKWIHPLLYTKTIGMKEQTITKHFQFKGSSIFRPGMLIRDYNRSSFLHRFFDSNNLGLRVNLLASAMIRDAEGFDQNKEYSSPFVYIGNKCIKSSISK